MISFLTRVRVLHPTFMMALSMGMIRLFFFFLGHEKFWQYHASLMPHDATEYYNTLLVVDLYRMRYWSDGITSGGRICQESRFFQYVLTWPRESVFPPRWPLGPFCCLRVYDSSIEWTRLEGQHSEKTRISFLASDCLRSQIREGKYLRRLLLTVI